MKNLQEDFELIRTNCNSRFHFSKYQILLLYIVGNIHETKCCKCHIESLKKKIISTSVVTEINIEV